MSIKKNIGKNTLGDNNKMSVRLHEYEMSTHDLSFVWRNTQSPGTIVPFMKIVAQKGDIFDIEMFNKTLTHPTVGPLFGSYKLQHFVFTCPIRLYNSWLHNNRTGIGMKMSDIKLPVINMLAYNLQNANHPEDGAVSNPSSLAAYLGYRGRRVQTNSIDYAQVGLNALPYLMYWDIYKNYFANKQEKNAYYVSGEGQTLIFNVTSGSGNTTVIPANQKETDTIKGVWNDSSTIAATNNATINWESFWGNTLIYTEIAGIKQTLNLKNLATAASVTTNKISIDATKWGEIFGRQTLAQIYAIFMLDEDTVNKFIKAPALKAFQLDNIDKARDVILGNPGNTKLIVNTAINFEPYAAFNGTTVDNGVYKSARRFPQYQLAVKTYDSDVFQNWVNTEWIDGTNGINEVSSIDVSDGKLTMDSLNLAQKVYNMLNRIAVSGGTYRDWLETVFTAGNYMERPETPVFEGGMSQYIEFEEVVSNSASEGEPLGTLAGRGKATQQKGSGKLHFKIQEPSYIIGVCAITPQIDYSQGNDWDIVELKTMDDLHKPALDGIGYQDSINEYRAYWSGYTTDEGKNVNTAPGKTVAWINYMTNFNKTFGNFASGQSESFMALNRNYEKTPNGQAIQDMTTYIDPSKHNEIFADTDINAMNFWLQTACNIKVRRNISAKQIPNL